MIPFAGKILFNKLRPLLDLRDKLDLRSTKTLTRKQALKTRSNFLDVRRAIFCRSDYVLSTAAGFGSIGSWIWIRRQMNLSNRRLRLRKK